MRKLKTGDSIIVIAGAHKGTKSTIVKIEEDKVFLHDVNKIKKAVKGQGFVEKEASIHISNIAYLDGDKASKISVKIDKKTGKKSRIAKKSGKTITEKSRKA